MGKLDDEIGAIYKAERNEQLLRSGRDRPARPGTPAFRPVKARQRPKTPVKFSKRG